ncbi:antirestriction protein [Pantoea agglomerans]|uniref:antirestriction protein n=1 Tax=Enterobacter agglomerans TaxID=549 RepID=UPI003C7ECE6E
MKTGHVAQVGNRRFPMNNETVLIEAVLVPDSERLAFLPSLLGSSCVYVENLVFNWMRKLSPELQPDFRMHRLDFQEMHYDGGVWEFYRLSNGGFFMAPAGRESYRVSVAGNYFDDELSGNAAGIVATLFALNQMTHTNHPHTQKCYDLYWLLRDYASQLPETNMIRAAID